jgi:hypothetical protein
MVQIILRQTKDEDEVEALAASAKKAEAHQKWPVRLPIVDSRFSQKKLENQPPTTFTLRLN